jgi:glycosyltransferase involved in cell wall biosynthesis
MRIAYLSTCLPRECGIATFNNNLIQAIQVNLRAKQIAGNDFIIALNDSDNRDEYEYPRNVKYIIRQQQQQDYLQAAELINNSDVDVCVMQHEFGIYGGQSGLYILSLVQQLEKPLVTVFHTILKEPSYLQKIIIREIARHSAKVIVINKRAIALLSSVYTIPREKIELIGHGVPDLEPPIKNPVKDIPPFKGNKVLLTFGLINRGKGLETVIRALPRIAEKHPDIMYVVVGNTHPGVKKINGEEYRDHLKDLARELKVDKHLSFINRFVPEQELVNYLSAAEIYVTPYLNAAQISSGSLSYAIGAGAAVLSTPYWHARELLDEDRGVLFDFRDADGLATVVIDLLDNPYKLSLLRQNAYEYGKQLRWPQVGNQYLSMLKEVLNKPVNGKKTIKRLIDADRLPIFSLAHVTRMTDSTGIIQHARYAIPHFKEGYSLDDNTRALIMVLMAYEQKKNPEALKLLPVYLSYIQYMQKDDGQFRNFLSFDRRYLDEECSEDGFGRTIWALGYLIGHSPAGSYREFADALFQISVPNYKKLVNLRGYANTLIGIAYFLRVHPSHEKMFGILVELTDLLMDAYTKNHDHNWHWFEDRLFYDNAILPLALFHSAEITGDAKIKKVALDTLRFLEHKTFKNGHFNPVGNDGWHHRDDGATPVYDQQPVETMGMVLLYNQAYESTQNPEYIRKMFATYMWFLGENILRVPLYDHETKGCCDGLEPAGINRNQGAESTLACLVAHLTILKALEKENEYDPLTEQVESFSGL